MVVHGKQTPLNEVRLDRLAEPDGDIRLAHVEVQLAVIEDEMEIDRGIAVEKLLDAFR
jgi:hypothetical protein